MRDVRSLHHKILIAFILWFAAGGLLLPGPGPAYAAAPRKHLSLTGHVYSSHVDLANLVWFNNLPEADQELISRCMREAALRQRAHNRANEAAYLAGLKENGMQVVDNPDMASFRARAEQLVNLPMYRSGKVRDLLNRMLEATKEE